MALKFGTEQSGVLDRLKSLKAERELKNNQGFIGKLGSRITEDAKGVGNIVKEAGIEVAGGLRGFGSDIRKLQTGRANEGQGLLGRTVQNFSKAQEGIKEAKINEVQGNQSGTTSLLQSMGLLGLATSDTIADTFISGLQTIATDEVEKAVQDGLKKAVESKGGQFVANEIKKAEEGYEYLKRTDPEKARNYKALFGAISLAGDVTGLGAIQKSGTATKEALRTGTQTIKESIKTGVENIGEVVTGKAKDVNNVVNKVGNIVGSKLENTGESLSRLRNNLSGLEERDVFALERIPKEKWSEVIEQAKKARIHPESDYAQTPYHLGAKKANEAFNELELNLAKNQKERMNVIANSKIGKIDTAQVRSDIVKDVRDTFNLDTITTEKGKVNFNPVEGREVLLDEMNPRDLQALKLVEKASQSKSPLEMMDSIKKMQNIIYDSSLLNKTSNQMKSFVERSIGKLNASFKKQVGEKYKNILTEMSEDIKLKQDLDSVFKAGVDEVGNRGELAMKRIASGTTTSSDVRNLALKIKERLGIDLIQEARLRQLAMDIVGDNRGGTLFNKIQEGKSGLVARGIEGIIDRTPLSKESTAMKRAGTQIDFNTTKNANNSTDITLTSNTGNETNNGGNYIGSDMNTSRNTNMALKEAPLKEAEQGKLNTSKIITPQTAEKGVILESKKGLENTKMGTTKKLVPEKSSQVKKQDDLKGLVDTTDYTKVEEPNLNIDIESLPKKGEIKKPRVNPFLKKEMDAPGMQGVQNYGEFFGNGNVLIKGNLEGIRKGDTKIVDSILSVKGTKITEKGVGKINTGKNAWIDGKEGVQFSNGAVIQKDSLNKLKRVHNYDSIQQKEGVIVFYKDSEPVGMIATLRPGTVIDDMQKSIPKIEKGKLLKPKAETSQGKKLLIPKVENGKIKTQINNNVYDEAKKYNDFADFFEANFKKAPTEKEMLDFGIPKNILEKSKFNGKIELEDVHFNLRNTKTLSNKGGFIDPVAMIQDISKALTKLTPKNTYNTAVIIAKKLGVEVKKVHTILKEYVSKYGEDLKGKLGELSENLAEKVGAKQNLMPTNSKQVGKDFNKVGTTESALDNLNKKVFHTSSKEIDKLDNNKILWTTEDLEYANIYGKKGSRITYDIDISNINQLDGFSKEGISILDAINNKLPKNKKFSSILNNDGGVSAFFIQDDIVVLELRKLGYDAVKVSELFKGGVESIGIINPTKISNINKLK